MQIWLFKDGLKQGPYDHESIRQQLIAGSLSLEDAAWIEGWNVPGTLGHIPGLSNIPVPPAPYPPNGQGVSNHPPTPQNKARRCDDIRNIELYLGRFGVDRSTLDFVAGLCRSPRAIPTVGRRLQNVDDFFRRTWFFRIDLAPLHGNRFVKPQIMGENGDNFLRRLFPCHVMRFFPRRVHDRFRDQSSARGRPRWFRRWFHRCFVIFGSLFDSLVGLHEQPEDA